MHKRWMYLSTVIGLGSLCLPLQAEDTWLQPYSVTDGGVSNHGFINLSGNPAAPASARSRTQKTADGNETFNSGGSVGIIRAGVGASFGKIDDVFDEADELNDILNEDDLSGDDVAAAENLLLTLEKEGYGDVSANLAVVPFEMASQKSAAVWTVAPLQANAGLGFDFTGADISITSTLNFDESSSGENHACNAFMDTVDNFDACEDQLLEDIENYLLGNGEDYLLSDPECSAALTNGDDDAVLEACSNVFGIDSDAEMEISAAVIGGAQLGYSRQYGDFKRGEFFFGGRVKVLHGTFYTASEKLSGIDDSEEYFEDLRDDYEDNATDDMGLGVDLGVIWNTPYWRAGYTLDNAIRPTFEINDAGTKYRPTRQGKVEISLFPKWRWINASYYQELDRKEDYHGKETRWNALSLGFTSSSVWIPHFRVGRREEEVSGLKYSTLGFSLFRFLHLDIAQSDDEVIVDGDKTPQSFYAVLGLEFNF